MKTNHSRLSRLFDQSLLFFQEEVFSRVIRNTSLLLGGRVASSVLGIVTLAIVARTLGPELFSLLVLIQTYILVIDGIFNFQSWQALVKFGAEKVKTRHPDEFVGLIKVGFLLDVLSAGLAAVLAAGTAHVFANIIGRGDFVASMVIIYSLTILSNLIGSPTAVLKIFGRFSLLSAARIATAVLRLVAILLAVNFGGGLVPIVLAYVLSEIAGNLLILAMGVAVLNRNGFRLGGRFRCSNWKEVIRFAFWTNIVSTVDLPIKQLDVFMVASILSLESVGVYRIIKSVSRIFAEAASPVFMTVFPESAMHIASDESDRSFKLALKANALMATLFIPSAFAIGLTSNWWVAKFFGPEYLGVYTAMFLYIIFSAVSASNMAIHPHFLAQGYVRMNFSIVTIANLGVCRRIHADS